MFLEQSFRTLLKLLRADFFCTHSLGDDERTPRNFPETLGKDLCVDDVALNDIKVVVFSESRVHLSGVDLLRCFEEESVFIKGHFNDSDVVGFGQSSHEVAKGGVETPPTAGGNHVGRKGP